MQSESVADRAHLTDRLFGKMAENRPSGVAIVPGDPDRVRVLAEFLSDVDEFSFRRGYRGATGTYKGVPVYVLSSGVGGPSFERSLVELHLMGVHTVIRVGTTGAMQPHIAPGDLIVNEGAVRLDGTSENYAPLAYPAAAAWEVVSALVDSATAVSGVRPHVGIGATTSSFFAGQERETLAGWFGGKEGVFSAMQRAGVLNFEMEAATLFTLARLFGMRAGAVCAVVNNRLERVMGGVDAIRISCEVALDAVAALEVSAAAAKPAEAQA